jgi:L-gulonate 5-dehydrogenase
MRAAVTHGVGAMAVVERVEPSGPGSDEVVVAPEAVGICGSDYHFYTGELSAEAGGSLFPRVQGHEFAGRIVAVGPGVGAGLEAGQRVAVYPLRACGDCYPCAVGRLNTCDNFSLIGIHIDGGLQERMVCPADQVFPICVSDAAVAAMAEPMSVAVHAVARGRVGVGERVVVLGAGPIGQCLCLVARELGAELLVVDLQEGRLALSRELGVSTLVWKSASEVLSSVRQWAGAAGPPVVIDATGAPAAVRAMVDMVASAGRAVQVGMSAQEVPIRIGSLTEKEIDLLGVSCCSPSEFGEAVTIVERNEAAVARLISHRFPLDEAPDAIRFAIGNPTEVMKVVISCG